MREAALSLFGLYQSAADDFTFTSSPFTSKQQQSHDFQSGRDPLHKMLSSRHIGPIEHIEPLQQENL